MRRSASEVPPPEAWKSAPRLHEDGVEGAPSPLPVRSRDIDIDAADASGRAFAAVAFAAAVLAVSVAVTVPGCRGASGGMNWSRKGEVWEETSFCLFSRVSRWEWVEGEK